MDVSARSQSKHMLLPARNLNMNQSCRPSPARPKVTYFLNPTPGAPKMGVLWAAAAARKASTRRGMPRADHPNGAGEPELGLLSDPRRGAQARADRPSPSDRPSKPSAHKTRRWEIPRYLTWSGSSDGPPDG